MKIPKQLNIAGHIYKIEFRKRSKEDGSNNPASCNISEHIIWIEEEQCQQEKEACLLHEIFEVIKYHYDLKIEHKDIVLLETGMYQVLKDNKLLMDK